MRAVSVKGVKNPMSFPDDMSLNDIRSFLRGKYAQRAVGGQSDVLAPAVDTVSPTNPTLAERGAQGVSDFLFDKGVISDRYGAQQIGRNVSAIGEMLPVIGDVAAADEFGRAAAKGDNLGMAMAGLGVIPVAGDAAKRLYKTHNVTAGGLEKANQFGGIPAPSIAIAGKDNGFESFGDISLVGSKNSFAKDPTFASDVYSPRTPRLQYEIDPAAARAEATRISGDVDPRIDSGFDSQFKADNLSDDITRLEGSVGNKASFLSGIGEAINPAKFTSNPAKFTVPKWFGDSGFSKSEPPNFKSFEDEAFNDSANKFVSDIDPNREVSDWYDGNELSREGRLMVLKGVRDVQQKIRASSAGPQFDRTKARAEIDKRIKKNQSSFDSYISDQKSRISTGQVFTKWNPKTGTSKKFEANLDNAVKLMKGNIRGGEGFNYGAGSIRAQATPQLKSMKQITDRRGQIVGADEMTMVKEGFDSRLDNLYEDLKGNWAFDSEPSYSDFSEGLEAAARGDMSDFKGLSAEQKNEMSGFFDELANAPTNYFEIKPQRAVDIGEFFGAAVPFGTSKEVIDGLKAKGLKIQKYKPDERMDAIEKLNVKSKGNIFFSGAGAAILYKSTGDEEEDTNS